MSKSELRRKIALLTSELKEMESDDSRYQKVWDERVDLKAQLAEVEKCDDEKPAETAVAVFDTTKINIISYGKAKDLINIGSPKDLQKLVDDAKALKIKGIDDTEGYEAVDKARKGLMRARTGLTKAGKDLREEANKFTKAVREQELKLIGIIEPMEKELIGKTDEIDQLRIMEKRRESLPERVEKLKEFNCELTEEELLAMDDLDFNADPLKFGLGRTDGDSE